MNSIDIVTLLQKWEIEYVDLVPFFQDIGDKTAIRYRNGKPFRRNYERGLLLYAIATHFKCKTFLEIGTGRGYVSTCVSHCSTIESIYTIDNESAELAKEAVKSTGLKTTKKINFIDDISENLLNYNIPKNVDLIFIDGDHSYNGASSDFKLTKEMSNIVVFDDYRQKHFGVRKLIDKIIFKQQVAFATVINTDGWIYQNEFIKYHGDADVVIEGKEYKSGQVLTFVKEKHPDARI